MILGPQLALPSCSALRSILRAAASASTETTIPRWLATILVSYLGFELELQYWLTECWTSLSPQWHSETGVTVEDAHALQLTRSLLGLMDKAPDL